MSSGDEANLGRRAMPGVARKPDCPGRLVADLCAFKAKTMM